MCGIVGYVGKRPAEQIILAGLRRLEYRGYDSAGISLLDDGGIAAVRSVGNLDQLESKLTARAARGDGGGSRSRSRRRRRRSASVTRAGPRTAA